MLSRHLLHLNLQSYPKTIDYICKKRNKKIFLTYSAIYAISLLSLLVKKLLYFECEALYIEYRAMNHNRNSHFTVYVTDTERQSYL